MSKRKTDSMTPGFQKKLKRIWHIEEQRREGKRPPLERQSDEEFQAKIIQAFVDKFGELPHPKILGEILSVKSRAERADEATTLRPDDPDDRPIAAMFEFFSLDHRDPVSWRQMVWLFAHVFFEQKGRGKLAAPEEWPPEKTAKLTTIVAANPDSSAAELARTLVKTKLFQTKGASGRGLRRRIGIIRSGLKAGT